MDRLQVSLRLKAARHLAGRTNAKGQAVPIPVVELVEREPLKANGVSQNRIEDIEQMKVDARPMELEKIAEALGQPASLLLIRPPVDEARRLMLALERELVATANQGLAGVPPMEPADAATQTVIEAADARSQQRADTDRASSKTSRGRGAKGEAQ